MKNTWYVGYHTKRKERKERCRVGWGDRPCQIKDKGVVFCTRLIGRICMKLCVFVNDHIHVRPNCVLNQATRRCFPFDQIKVTKITDSTPPPLTIDGECYLY